jgi:nucleotide-binding universal stress UspA family protein
MERSGTSADESAGRNRRGPVVIAYDGSPAAEYATREAGALLAGRPALVVVVWKAGLGFEGVEPPTSSIGMPPTSLDIRTALEVDRAMMDRAEQLAQKGAGIARDAGFDAEGLAVADDIETSVADTIVTVARERDAQALVVGAHGHGRLEEALLGSTSREVIRHGPCPVVVVRESQS